MLNERSGEDTPEDASQPHRPAVIQAGSTTWAPRAAQVITLLALSGYGFVALINVLTVEPHRNQVLAFLAVYTVVFGLQIVHSTQRLSHWPAHRRMTTLVVQAIATYVPFIWIGKMWGGMAGFLAGSILLAVSGRVRWVIYSLTGVSMLVPALMFGMNGVDVAYLTISTLLTGLVVYGMSLLSRLVVELHETRLQMARMAVTQERLRFARDLHDLLGYSLSAITLKNELIYRLLPRNAARALEEVEAVLAIARQALADVRTVASGYRDMSLAVEADSAQSVLSAAGVEAQVEIFCGTVPQAIDTVMATVLREAITNVLRHSKARRCIIQGAQNWGVVSLQVINDGVEPAEHASLASDGTGLGNLATRLEGIGGNLLVDVRDDSFHVLAFAPLDAEPLSAPASTP